MDSSAPPDTAHRGAVQLTLSRWVIFVDWHGVLSSAPFWHTILWNERHPYHREIDHRTGELFRDGQLIDAWMRGRITTAQVLEQVQVHLDRRAGQDFLARRLLADCRNMPLADAVGADRSQGAPAAGEQESPRQHGPIPPPPTSIRFTVPPDWPTPPPGWVPPPGWRPDPAWPPAPEGWQWWVPTWD